MSAFGKPAFAPAPKRGVAGAWSMPMPYQRGAQTQGIGRFIGNIGRGIGNVISGAIGGAIGGGLPGAIIGGIGGAIGGGAPSNPVGQIGANLPPISSGFAPPTMANMPAQPANVTLPPGVSWWQIVWDWINPLVTPAEFLRRYGQTLYNVLMQLIGIPAGQTPAQPTVPVPVTPTQPNPALPGMPVPGGSIPAPGMPVPGGGSMPVPGSGSMPMVPNAAGFNVPTAMPATNFTARAQARSGYVIMDGEDLGMAPGKYEVLKEIARKFGWRSNKAPVTRGDMKNLTRAASTARRLERIARQAGAVTATAKRRKSTSKSRRRR